MLDKKTTQVVNMTTDGQQVKSLHRAYISEDIKSDSSVVVPKQEVSLSKVLAEINSSQNKGLRVITVKQLKKLNFKEVPTLLTPFFPQVGVAALAGSSDTGKSSLLRQLAYSIANKESEFLGFPLNLRFGKALYISTEDNDQAMSALFNRLPSDSSSDENADENLGYVFETPGLASDLNDYLQDHPVDCVFIDAFSDIYDGDLNALNRVRSFIQIFSEIAQRHQCLILFLHHTGKRTDLLVPSKDNVIGSVGFEGKMRALLELRRDPNDPSLRHLCVLKGNYIGQEHKNESYALRFNEESMTFQNTGQRVTFQNLAKRSSQANEAKQQATDLAIASYFQENKSIREIQALFESRGYPWKRSTIHKIINDHKQSKAVAQAPITFVDTVQPINLASQQGLRYEMDPESHFED
ncbi:AAA family ATPase [Spirosoma endbachense]|uniref:AAA family ATPase n=1 Tax=Spirosoma endbachense TaxID=2666025 RepID=A0A6P1VMV4_9BACT|nr:AAA family ATPase [Spirosoma endbachense]QHV94621.1 AAA family ATPase [Spirosoma endbachense]